MHCLIHDVNHSRYVIIYGNARRSNPPQWARNTLSYSSRLLRTASLSRLFSSSFICFLLSADTIRPKSAVAFSRIPALFSAPISRKTWTILFALSLLEFRKCWEKSPLLVSVSTYCVVRKTFPVRSMHLYPLHIGRFSYQIKHYNEESSRVFYLFCGPYGFL